MVVNPLAWAWANPMIVGAAVLALVLLAWAYDAYEDAEENREAVRGFLGRARSGAGTGLSLSLGGLVTAVTALTMSGMTLVEAVGEIVALAPDFPVLAGGVLTVGLGALGLSGTISVPWWQFGLFGMFVLLLGVAWRLQE